MATGGDGEFRRAAQELKAAGLAGRVAVSDACKLELYGLFKQATDGDCRKAQPSAFQPVERAKWNSWNALQGTSSAEARRRYILKVAEIMPSFKPSIEAQEDGARPTQETTARATEGRVERPHRQARRSTQTLSYAMIMLQLMGICLGSGVGVWTLMSVVYPVAYQNAVERFGQEYCDSTMRSFSPVLWFSVGYLVVVALRSRVFPWRLLSGEFVWVSLGAPRPGAGRRTGHRRRRRQQAETPTQQAIKKYGIKLVTQAAQTGGGLETPYLELALPEDAGASIFGESTTVIPFTVEQTSDVYYRKFKEPLPDPASRLLVAIVPMEEHRFEEYNAVFKRRMLRFRNDTPYLIKRFANAEFVEYVEDTLFDEKNQRFYVYVKNLSFQNLGVLEDYSVYQPEAENWTELHQYCRVHITSSSLSFFRAKIEAFISDFYGKNAPLARQYHVERLTEEFGNPAGLPPVDA